MQKQRNPMAGILANPTFRQRKVRPAKGKGSYTRKGRAKVLPFSFARLRSVKVNGSLPPR